MELISFLESKGGLAFLYFTQTILFSMMVYVLAAEYKRTRRDDLVYKLMASCSITAINLVTTASLVFDVFYGVQFSQRFLPLILNSLFAIIVLSLARAFIFNFVANKDGFARFIRFSMAGVLAIYVITQVVWLAVYRPGMLFAKSYLQLGFSIFFIAVLFFSIYHLVKYRKTYRARLVIAFSSIVVAQFVTILGTTNTEMNPVLNLIRAASPILVPTMFGSVVFKELIESVVTMVDHLKKVLENQRDLVFDLMKLGSELSMISDDLVKTSLAGWQKLSLVVENIHAQDNDRSNLLGITASTIHEAKAMKDRLTEARERNVSLTGGNVAFRAVDIDASVRAAYEKTLLLADSLSGSGRSGFLSAGDSAESIRGVIRQIQEIADQTAMLSLNASIEASRAGEYGKGFAVVADGINSLSDRTSEHTTVLERQCELLIGYSQKSSAVLKQSIDEVRTILEYLSSIREYFRSTAASRNATSVILEEVASDDQKNLFSSDRILEDMTGAEFIVSKNRKHGDEMRDTIGTHIREIESIAGLSDTLNGMISDLNLKTNNIIRMAESLHDLTFRH